VRQELFLRACLENGQRVSSSSSFSFSSSVFELVFKEQEEKEETRGFLRLALSKDDEALLAKQ